MPRRNSLLNSAEDPQPSTNSATQELPTTDFNMNKASTEDYDAAAAALSRLSVLTEQHRLQDGVSPQMNEDSTYETAIISSCPSPTKRGSEFFDRPLVETNLKRLRRESQQKSSCPFRQDFSLASTMLMPDADNSNGVVRGLGLLNLPMELPVTMARPSRGVTSECHTPVAPASPTFVERGVYRVHDTASSTARRPSIGNRRRSSSVPISPSARWLEQLPKPKKQSMKELLLFRQKTPTDKASRRSRDTLQVSLPPITQQTLKELELSEIFKNAQLRHDIVHDPNLQFRPNTDGERGAKKRHEARKYWRAVARELEDVQNVPAVMLPHTRLAVMFQEMKHILLSLVPVSERIQLETSFDHDLFLQMLNHGLFSPTVFAKYLCGLMKRHCAPMRDDAIDVTVRQISTANSSVAFTDALRATFDILEIMKLDVANHQLRTLRSYLLDTSVEFEKAWFCRKYNNGTFAHAPVVAWFKSLVDRNTAEQLDYKRLFLHGFTAFFPNADTKPTIPSTFTFDQGRISCIHKDIRELTSLLVVVLLAKQLIRGFKNEDVPELKTQIWALLSEKVKGNDRWASSVPSIALQLASLSTLQASGGKTKLPTTRDISFATSWLTTNLATNSPIFSMVHARLTSHLSDMIYDEMTATTVNGVKTLPTLQWGFLDACAPEVQSVATRMFAVVSYHWKVHGANYIQWSQA